MVTMCLPSTPVQWVDFKSVHMFSFRVGLWSMAWAQQEGEGSPWPLDQRDMSLYADIFPSSHFLLIPF